VGELGVLNRELGSGESALGGRFSELRGFDTPRHFGTGPPLIFSDS
jgi:hypothetical protein